MARLQVGIILCPLLLSALLGGASRVGPIVYPSTNGPDTEVTVVPLTQTEGSWTAFGMPLSLAEEQENGPPIEELNGGQVPSLLQPWPEDALSMMKFEVVHNLGRFSLRGNFSLLDAATGEVLLAAVKESGGYSFIIPGKTDACLATLAWTNLRDAFTLTRSFTIAYLNFTGFRMGSKPQKLQVKLTAVNGSPAGRYISSAVGFTHFCNRVMQQSSKNFILTSGDLQRSVPGCQDAFMVFGKTGKNEFMFDLKAPVSVVQAFGLAIASIIRKAGVV